MAISWNPITMATGVTEVDEQHKVLIEQLNALLTAMRDGRGKEEVNNLLSFLGEYAVMHFGFEEDCMDRHQCPFATQNRESHARFIQIFDGLSRRIAMEGPSLALVIEVQRQVSDWLQNHIVKVDRHLRNCVGVG